MKDLFAISSGCAIVSILAIATIDWALCGIAGLDGRRLILPEVTLIAMPVLTGGFYLLLHVILRGLLPD